MKYTCGETHTTFFIYWTLTSTVDTPSVRIHEKPTEFIHATSKILNSTRCCAFNKEEVNCSLDPTPWTVCLFRKATPSLAPPLQSLSLSTRHASVPAGEIVLLQDPNNLAFLTVVIEPNKLQKTDSADVVLVPDVKIAISSNKADSSASVIKYLGMQFLWVIEKSSAWTGGDIDVHNDEVLLRDLNTSLFMKVGGDGRLTAIRGRKNAGRFSFRFAPSVAANMSGMCLSVDSPVVLFSENYYIGVAKISTDKPGVKDSIQQSKLLDRSSLFSAQAEGNTASPFDVDHLLGKCEATADRADAISMLIRSRNSTNFGVLVQHLKFLEGLNVHIGLAMTQILRQLEERTRQMLGGSSNAFELSLLIKNAQQALVNLNDFLSSDTSEAKRGTPSSSSSSSSSSEQSDGISIRERMQLLLDPVKPRELKLRQSILCEQGVLDALLDIIELAGSGCYDHQMLSQLEKYTQSHEVYGRRQSYAVPKRTETQRRSSTVGGLVNAQKDTQVGRRVSLTSLSSKQKGTARHETTMLNYERIIHATDVHSSGSGGGVGGGGGGGGGDETKNGAAQSISQRIASSCLQCLFRCIQDHPVNQLHIADRMKILLEQIKKKERLAITCFEELLRNNQTILESKIHQSEIDALIELLDLMPLDPMILNLIRRTCSCATGVDATQRMVTYALMGKSKVALDSNFSFRSLNRDDSFGTNQALVLTNPNRALSSDSLLGHGNPPPNAPVIITIGLNRAITRPTSWSKKETYSPIGTAKRSNGVGQEALSDALTYRSLQTVGLPQVWVSWQSTGGYSMKRIFDYDDHLPLSLLCKEWKQAYNIFNKKAKRGNSKRSDANRFAASILSPDSQRRSRQSHYIAEEDRHPSQESSHVWQLRLKQEYKRLIGDYFIAQLYLIADLCLDRNYVAIGILQRHYPYEALLTILKMEEVPNAFKAPVCRILCTLYVDRDPQVACNFPRYVRSIISKGQETQGTPYNWSASTSQQDLELNPHPFKFSLLQQVVSGYLSNELLPHSLDEMSNEMIHLLHALFNFGFFVHTEQINDVIQPLNALLESCRSTVGEGSRTGHAATQRRYQTPLTAVSHLLRPTVSVTKIFPHSGGDVIFKYFHE